jgi:hypothetical protein
MAAGRTREQLHSGRTLIHQLGERPRTRKHGAFRIEIDHQDRASRRGRQAYGRHHREHVIDLGVEADDRCPGKSHMENVWVANTSSNPLSNVMSYVISGGFRRLCFREALK